METDRFRFVIGVDARVLLGAALERSLRRLYDLAEFNIVEVECAYNPREESQVAWLSGVIAKALCDHPARYYVGISGNVVKINTSFGQPALLPVISSRVLDYQGEERSFLKVNWVHYLPLKYHERAARGTPPDILDILTTQIVGTVGPPE